MFLEYVIVLEVGRIKRTAIPIYIVLIYTQHTVTVINNNTRLLDRTIRYFIRMAGERYAAGSEIQVIAFKKHITACF